MGLSQTLTAIDPGLWTERVRGYRLDPFQLEMLRYGHDQIVLATRQFAGKSFCAAARALLKARFYPGSTVVIISPTHGKAANY